MHRIGQISLCASCKQLKSASDTYVYCPNVQLYMHLAYIIISKETILFGLVNWTIIDV